MARPFKTGLDYFALDVDIDEDDKIFDLLDEMGTAAGLGYLIYILKEVYKNGYYADWNETSIKKFCRKKALDVEAVKQATGILTGTNIPFVENPENPPFFDRQMYRDQNILTSAAVQRRYLLACERRRKTVFDRRFILFEYETGPIPVRRKNQQTGKYETREEVRHHTIIDGKPYQFEFNVNGIVVNASNNPVNASINVNAYINPKRKEKRNQMEKESINNPENKCEHKPKNPFEPTAGLSLDSLIQKWNSFNSLPSCRYMSVNLPRSPEISRRFAYGFSQEDLEKAIENYASLYSDLEYKTGSLQGFLLMNSFDDWLEENRPLEKYGKKEASNVAAYEYCDQCGERKVSGTCLSCEAASLEDAKEAFSSLPWSRR